MIAEALAIGPTACAFSAGRDSCALALLAHDVAPKMRLVRVETGLSAPELRKFAKRFGGRLLDTVEPDQHPFKTWKTAGYLPIGSKVAAALYRRANAELRISPKQCCQRHKGAPLRAYIKARGLACILSGARGDDSSRHSFKLLQGEIFATKHGHHLAYPLLTWTAADTLDFLADRLPNYPFVYARSEELGCEVCAINLTLWPNQLSKLRERNPEKHRQAIEAHGFGEEILMIRYGLTRQGARDLIARDGLDALIDAGAFDRIPRAKKGLR